VCSRDKVESKVTVRPPRVSRLRSAAFAVAGSQPSDRPSRTGHLRPHPPSSKALRRTGPLSLLYLSFRLSLSRMHWMSRWDCLPACRREGSGADEFVTLWHGPLVRCVGSQNRSLLCPKLEPLIERPSTASSYVQE
jgi:hypothetical protein